MQSIVNPVSWPMKRFSHLAGEYELLQELVCYLPFSLIYLRSSQGLENLQYVLIQKINRLEAQRKDCRL